MALRCRTCWARYDLIDSSGAMFGAPPIECAAPATIFTASGEDGALWREDRDPPAGDGPIWARVRFQKRSLGRAIAAVYKPASLRIDVYLNGENDRILLASAGQAGLLLFAVEVNVDSEGRGFIDPPQSPGPAIAFETGPAPKSDHRRRGGSRSSRQSAPVFHLKR